MLHLVRIYCTAPEKFILAYADAPLFAMLMDTAPIVPAMMTVLLDKAHCALAALPRRVIKWATLMCHKM